MGTKTFMREEVSQLENKHLLVELKRPTENWNDDVLREAVYRIFKLLLEKK